MQEVEAEMAQQLNSQTSSSIEKDIFAPSNIQPGHLLFKGMGYNLRTMTCQSCKILIFSYTFFFILECLS